MVEISPTRENRALASTVNARIRSDARLLNAKAAAFRLSGIGVMLALAGIGVGAAFYGYSYLNDPTLPAERVAQALAKVLEKVTLKTAGEVALDPKASVRMDPDAIVKLDPAATVRLDQAGQGATAQGATGQGATGLGAPQMPRPTSAQLGLGAEPPGPASSPAGANASPKPVAVTNFTVFKQVPLGSGQVVTGWKFQSSEETVPSYQYCYYTQKVDDGSELKIDLAENGRAVPGAGSSARARGAELQNAAGNCVWFRQGL